MSSPDLSIPKEDVEETAAEETENITQDEADCKRMKLIQLSEEGSVSQSVKYIKKASNRVISKLYAKHEYMQQDKTNAILADVLIVKFSELMGMLDTVASSEELTNELREDKLLQGNVKSAVSFLTPFIPFIGLVSVGATLGKNVMKHRASNFGGGEPLRKETSSTS